MVCFRIVCREKFMSRCIICCIALTLSFLYILIQNNILVKIESSKSKETNLKINNALALKLDEKESRSSDKDLKRELKVDTPLIYMHTKRLHTPLTYDESCEITRDPQRFEDSHAVVFHAKDLPISKGLARLRSKSPFINQLWVYFNLESPINTRKLRQNEMLFNFTITPMRSSDLYHPYGYHFAKAETEVEQEKDFYETKIRFIAWCVSNCKVEYRNGYVKIMQKYTTVDVYGGCSGLFGTSSVCERESHGCNKFLATYKFYLAFENSLCEDYVTEKYWGALHRGNVPIVMAANNDTMIPGSYINVLDFKTVRDLVKYLEFLDGNREAYMKYFLWRSNFELDFLPGDSRRSDIWLPQFCDILLDRDWSQRKIVNISHFYSVENNCPRDVEQRIIEMVLRGV